MFERFTIYNEHLISKKLVLNTSLKSFEIAIKLLTNQHVSEHIRFRGFEYIHF